MHKLLEKQLKKATEQNQAVDLACLIDLVSVAYTEADRDRRRTDHSIEMMIEELDDLNRGLEAKIETQTSELKRTASHLEATLKNVDQGIVLIDPENRVVLFNDRFVQYSGLTHEICSEHPQFRALVERMHANGEFALMDQGFQQWVTAKAHEQEQERFSFRRTRPDGTILEIVIKRLANGGELRVMSDVTNLVNRQAEIESIRRTLEATVENVSQGIMMVDAHKNIVFFNGRTEDLLGLPKGFLAAGQTLQSLLEHQIDSGEFSNMSPEFVDFVRKGGILPQQQVYERIRPNGVAIEVRTTPMANGGMVRTFTDITEAKTREEAMRLKEAEYRSLYENSVVGIYRSTPEGQFLRTNPAFARLNGYDSEEDMVGKITHIAHDWYIDPRRRDEFLEIMARDGRVYDFVSEVYRAKTHERVWVSESAWLVRDEQGEPLYFEGMVADATERKAAEHEIAYLALHDGLTGLPNRTLFLEKLRGCIEANRIGNEIAVLCLDLDRFKDVNDTLGHDAGDILLKLAARRLSRLTPRNGLPSRFGGDEFAVICPDLSDRSGLVSFAGRLVNALSRPYKIHGKPVYVGASIGIALFPIDGLDATELLKRADIALYRAKQNGRGTFVFFDQAMTAAIQVRRQVEIELRSAIERDEFEMYYQPIIDLETGQPACHEALIRWNHPTRGLLSPFHFVEIAEETGLILRIGEIALRQACQVLACSNSEGSVAVNLSPVQFRNHQLTASVVAALTDSGLPAHRLVLEITESVLLTDDTHTLEILQQLRALGVRIALDDFGVGHSSLSYLQKFPFDKIKIDKSFVQEGESTMNMAIRRAMLGLGNDVGMEVVVEGVETEVQRDMLIYEGCRYAQGYLFSKPMPKEKAFPDLDLGKLFSALKAA